MTFAKYPVVSGGGGGGGGGIAGPVSSTDGGLVLWDGVDGSTVKDGGVGSANQVLLSNGAAVSFGLIGDANIGSSAGIAYSKLAALTANRALVSDGSGVVSASSVTATELGLLSGRSTGLVDTASTQTVGGSKTFSSALSAPSIALTATSNQMVFGSGTNKITINVPNNPAADLVYSFPNIAAVSLTGTVVLLEGANQTVSGNNFGFTNTVRFDSTTPLFLGDTPNRIVLLPATQTSPANWTFPNNGDSTFAALEGTQTFTGNKTFSGTVTLPATVSYTSNGSIVKSGNHALTLTTTGATNVTFPTSGTLAVLGANTFTAAQTITATTNQLVLGTTNTVTINSTAPSASRVYTIPDAGAAAEFVLSAGASTISGAKTFSGGIVISGGSAGNGAVWFASNVLRQRGGSSGWAVDNTSGAAILSATDAGALTVGPTAGGITHVTNGFCNFRNGSGGTAGFSLASNGGSATAFIVSAKATDDGVIGSAANDLVIRNSQRIVFSADSGSTIQGAISTAGAWTVGPSSGTANTIHSVVNRTTTATNEAFQIVKPGIANNSANNIYMYFIPATGNDGNIGNNGSGVLTLTDASDARLKENVRTASYGMQTISALRPVEFDWKSGIKNVKGFIAQEVKEVLPESVTIQDESERTGGFSDMHYLEVQTMIPVLVKAMQELHAEIQQLKRAS